LDLEGVCRGFVGRIYTSFNPVRVVDGVLTYGGRVVFVGSSRDVESLCNVLGCELVDLGSYTALPGFIDSHIHLLDVGEVLNSLDLRGVKSIEEFKSLLKEFSKSLGGWVIVRGFDHELLSSGRMLSRYDLDEVVPDKPVVAIRVCGHLGVLNSKALEVLRLLNEGKVDLSSGVVVEDVLDRVLERVRYEMSLDEFEKLLVDAQNHLMRFGVTSVGLISTTVSDKLLLALLSLQRKKALKIRVRMYMSYKTLKSLGLLTKVLSSLGNEWLRVVGVKFFADGSLGARTALLSKPYSDDPLTSGVEVMSRDELTQALRDVVGLGFQPAVHAIGDKALDNVLEAANTVGLVGPNSFRVEHASVVRDDQLELITKLRPGIAIQPHFILTDWWVVKRVGLERVRFLYRFKTLLNLNLVIGLSTDAPVEPVDPWETIYAAVTRGCLDSIELCRYSEDEKLTLTEALHLYTTGSARLLRDYEVGSLEVGMLADIVVVDRDPFKASDPKELRKVSTVKVFIGSEEVF